MSQNLMWPVYNFENNCWPPAGWVVVGRWLADSRDWVEVDSMLGEDVEDRETVDIVKPEGRTDSVRMSDKEVRMN